MLKRKRQLFIILAFLLSISSLAFGPPRQNDDLTINVEAGFSDYYRDGEWIPLEVTITNNGRDLRGALQVHAENSSQDTETLYQTPITVARDSSKTIFLYVSLAERDAEIEVEVVDNSGRILKVETARLTQLSSRDVLYAVVTESPVGAVTMTNRPVGRGNSYQSLISLRNLPTQADAMRALDVLLFFDVDTGNLSTDQREAIQKWVVGGGHLIIHGGPNWQRTTAGLMDLLPTQPEGTIDIESLAPLGQYLSSPSEPLEQTTVVTANTPKENAEVLFSIGDTPIIVRQTLGLGTVDFVALDPMTEPLRSYTETDAIWYTLLVNGQVRPSWSYGFEDWTMANDAARIITGFDLPSVLQLIGFLILYIVLIGPVNYYFLKLIGRRELAWFTIPALILVFTLLAYFTGFSLRGSAATVSHLAVVQVFPDSDTARVDGLVGVFSPRRTTYDLEVEGDMTLRTLPGFHDSNLGIEQIKLVESNAYRVEDLPVDAGIITTFATSGYIPAQHIEGEAVWHLSNTVDPSITGEVTNPLDFDFEDMVILVKDGFFELGNLAAGETKTFELAPSTNFDLQTPVWSPLGNRTDYSAPNFSYSTPGYYPNYNTYGCANRPLNTTATQVMTGKEFDCYGSTTDDGERALRRRSLLTSAINNEIDLSGGRGTTVYIVGWAEQSAFQVALEGTEQNNKYETLYIFELTTRFEDGDAEFVTIPPGLQTWTIADSDNPATRRDSQPYMVDVTTPDEQAVFRFAPLDEIPLASVDRLTLYTQILASSIQEVEFALWDWTTQEWVELKSEADEETDDSQIWQDSRGGGATDAAGYSYILEGEALSPFIGPNFAVQIQIRPSNIYSLNNASYSPIQAIEVTYQGQFTN